MSRHIKFIFSIIVASLLLGSCSLYNDNDETILQNVSMALKSPNTDFSKLESFVITDSILFVTENKQYRESNQFVESLLEGITSNMIALGYTRTADKLEADMIVDVSYVVSQTVIYYDPYIFWDWDYWWWDDMYPYNPYYPYFPYPMPVMYDSYYTGNMAIDILDMTTGEQRVPVIWHGLVRNLISGSNSAEDMRNAIDECFTILPPKN